VNRFTKDTATKTGRSERLMPTQRARFMGENVGPSWQLLSLAHEAIK
jgi:hypothetical protein